MKNFLILKISSCPSRRGNAKRGRRGLGGRKSLENPDEDEGHLDLGPTSSSGFWILEVSPAPQPPPLFLLESDSQGILLGLPCPVPSKAGHQARASPSSSLPSLLCDFRHLKT